jgi:hypothetical protein
MANVIVAADVIGVWVNGLQLVPVIEYSVSAGVLTFLNGVYNTDYIVAVYFTTAHSTDSRRGSACSGTDGTSNRILTLLNKIVSSSDVIGVWVNGVLLIPTTEYTVTNSGTYPTITFLNSIYDIDYIIVVYLSWTADVSGTYMGNILKRVGETVNIIQNLKSAPDKYGDITTTEYGRYVKGHIQVMTAEDQEVVEGSFKSGDLIGFFDSTTPYIVEGNIILYNTKRYQMIDVVLQPSLGGQAHYEVWARRI